MGKLARLYFPTTYREEVLVWKLARLYFPTTYREEGLVRKLMNFRLLTPPATLTTYTKEWLVGKRAHDRQWALP